MRWQQLDILPPLDTLVLLWLENGPILGQRIESVHAQLGWVWLKQDEDRDETISPATPLMWATVQRPRQLQD